MSVKRKMFVGFGAILLILGLVAAQTVASLLSIRQATSEVVEKHQRTVIRSLELSANLKAALGELGFYLLGKEKRHQLDYLNHLKMANALLGKLKQESSVRSDPKAERLVHKIESDMNTFKAYQDTMFTLATDRNKNFPAMSFSARNVNPLSQQLLQDVDTILRAEEDRGAGHERSGLIHDANEMRYAWARLMGGLRGYLGFRAASAVDEVKNYREYFSQQMTHLRGTYGKSLSLDQDAAMAEIPALLQKFDEYFKYILKTHGSDQWRQDAYLIRTKLGPLVQTLNHDIEQLVAMQVTNIQQIGNALVTQSTSTVSVVLIMLALAIGAVIALAILLTRGIIRPMTRAVESGVAVIGKVMQSVDDQGAAAYLEHIHGSDEIENVSSTLHAMTAALNDAVCRQNQQSEQLREKVLLLLSVVEKAARGDLTGTLADFHGTETIDELAENIHIMIANLNSLVTQVQHSGNQVNASTAEIAATARQQEATTTQQAASTSEVMATVTQISATSKELVKTMEEVTAVAEDTADSAADGHSALARMQETMHRMRHATETITGKLAVLSEKTGNISTVVTTITKVADQTNLLSLNAAIEAEKAGEYGRGFSVVASEIRRLADQTAVSTWDIEQMVKDMQSSVSAGVMGMDKFSEEVARAVDEVAQVGGQLAQIIEQVQTLTPRFETVNHGMQSQSDAAVQISESMTQLNETAQQTAASLRQSNQSIQQLKGAAQDLQTGVARFRVAS